MTGTILLTAWLNSPLAGEPPQLDSLLEWSLSPFESGFRRRQEGSVPHYRVDRRLPAPPQGVIQIPLARAWLGPWLVSKCSNPILPVSMAETVEHISKRLDTSCSGMLAERERKVVSTTNSWTKSYRLPLRIRVVSCVRWFCVSNERNLRKALRDVCSLGKKVSDGYGRIREWTIEPTVEDYSWFAKQGSLVVLMRTLPLQIDGCDWLPLNLSGFKRYYGSCVPPYWHQERFAEIVVPC